MAETTAAETWRERALRCETAGDLAGALAGYEAGLVDAPEDVRALAGLARVAGRLGMADQCLALWSRVLVAAPQDLEACDGLARALASLNRHAEAVDTLRAAILAHPHEARLWNSLGLLLAEQGDGATAITFFDEAIRLEPAFAGALYNRGDAMFDLGELVRADEDFAAAAQHAASPEQTATIAFARALLALHQGELGSGWDAYEARLSEHYPQAPVFEVPGVRWTPDDRLDGAHLLVVGEQGVGDEIMFAGLLGSALSALGPGGRLSLAVEPRLVTLMQRSFPQAKVVAHTTERRDGRPHRTATTIAPDRPVELWAPIGSLPRSLRRDLSAFSHGSAYLRADLVRTAAWRVWLAEQRSAGGLSVGVSWRSGLRGGRRRRQYPDLDAWAPVLRTPGVTFVNLQYSHTPDELTELETLAGAPILTPPGLDLKADLNDLAALCSALDIVISVPNATAALAGACGSQVWFLSGPAAWPRLGTSGYPWYANTRCFAAERFGAWTPPMQAVAAALAELSSRA